MNYDDAVLCCRGGKQIDFLGLNDNYNFELQEIVSLGSIKTIKQVGHNVNPNTTVSIYLVVVYLGFSRETIIVIFLCKNCDDRVMRLQWNAPTIQAAAQVTLRWVLSKKNKYNFLLNVMISLTIIFIFSPDGLSIH